MNLRHTFTPRGWLALAFVASAAASLFVWSLL